MTCSVSLELHRQDVKSLWLPICQQVRVVKTIALDRSSHGDPCDYATPLCLHRSVYYACAGTYYWSLVFPPMVYSSPISRDGFAAIPRPILDLLLCMPLSKRDLSILLLVIRLTYGCRNARWAHLKQADLAAVGIGPTHVKKCLQSLLSRELLVQNGARSEYRLNAPCQTSQIEKSTAARLERLTILVGFHLRTSQKGNSSPAEPTKKVTRTLPKGELYPYQKGNIQAAKGWSFLRSSHKFEKDFDTP